MFYLIVFVAVSFNSFCFLCTVVCVCVLCVRLSFGLSTRCLGACGPAAWQRSRGLPRLGRFQIGEVRPVFVPNFLKIGGIHGGILL